MQNGVTFWTEGGSTIGMGHIVRCINIAKSLRSFNIPFHFLVNRDSAVLQRLDSSGINHIVYPIDRTNGAKLTNDIVVIDTKKNVSKHVSLLKKAGKTVILIDNTTAQAEADGVVMPSAFYNGPVENENFNTGSQYLIIGENFRKHKKANNHLRYSLPLKVLVTMGGADPNNITEEVVNALKGVADIDVTVVLGPAMKPSSKLRNFIDKGSVKFEFLTGVTDMAPVIASSHIAFTAVGTTVYELAYMGVPSVLISNYEQDASDLKELEKLGISLSLGYHKEVKKEDIIASVERFKQSRFLWESMSHRAQNLTDGNGAIRIASLLESLIMDSSANQIHAVNI